MNVEQRNSCEISFEPSFILNKLSANVSTNFYEGNKMKQNSMGWKCITHLINEKCVKSKGKSPIGKPGRRREEL
jgi:hypothetical protein